MNEKDNKNLLLSYSPSDFFYVRADVDGIMPTQEQCKELDVHSNEWESTCDSKNYSDNAEECFKKELCKNKDRVTSLKDIESRNNGANRKYLDTKSQYNEEFINAINLGIGIIIVTAFIIKNTYVSI